MHFRHNFEQLHISQEHVISSVLIGIITADTLLKAILFRYPIHTQHTFTPHSACLSSPTLLIALRKQSTQESSNMHRSHTHLAIDGCLAITCQCLSIETFLVKKPRTSSLPVQPVFGVPIFLPI